MSFWDREQKPYLIAEIGLNHNGDVNIAKRLVDAAFSAGWSCAKFQKRDPEISTPLAQRPTIRETPWGSMTYLDYRRRLEFGTEEYDEIASYAAAKPIDWTASVWDVESVGFMARYDSPYLKIPSAHLTNGRLLKAVIDFGKPILMSTGMSTLEEVDHAVELLSASNADFALLHCNSSYPARVDELNLAAIPMLADRYSVPIGYSGHEFGLVPTIVAVTLGARIIERHVTVDRLLWGTDQLSSVELAGMDKLAKQVAATVTSLGAAEKVLWDSELPARLKLRGV